MLQGDFLQKHRALLGVRVFYQKISRKIIEALCSMNMINEALCSITSSVFRKVIVLCKGDEKAQSFAWGVGLCGRKHPGR